MTYSVEIFKNEKDENLKDFFKKNWVEIEKRFKKNGSALFRGFKVNSTDLFHNAINSVHKKIKNYSEASTPRTKVAKKIYTSTEYPSHKSIPLHNEMSYSKNYPKNLWFFCLKSAEEGGETTIANSHSVIKRIDSEIVKEFKSKKIQYVRRYGYGIDLSCEDVFGTADKNLISKQCEKKRIKYEWIDNNKLVTKEINNATLMHPEHNFEIWFNQAHLFHNSNLDLKTKKIVEKVLGKGIYSRDVIFGDGKNIPDDMFKNIRKAYNEEEQKINWESGDVVLLDNLFIAHGRNPFIGERKVFVAMTDD